MRKPGLPGFFVADTRNLEGILFSFTALKWIVSSAWSALWDSTFPLWAILPSFAPLILLVSAIIAFRTLKNNRKGREEDEKAATARDKRSNSFDHIAKQTCDRDLILMHEQFREVVQHLEKASTAPFRYNQVHANTLKHNNLAIDAEDVITKVFNYYEATAIGIELNALDEDIIKEWWRSSYVNDWIDFVLFVREKREIFGRPKLYCKFEEQARRWAIGDEIARL